MIENFDFKTMNELYENGQLKDHLDCKAYIEKYFTPLTNGSHAQIEDGKLEFVSADSMATVYLNRFEDDIKIWYKKKTIPKKIDLRHFKITYRRNVRECISSITTRI